MRTFNSLQKIDKVAENEIRFHDVNCEELLKELRSRGYALSGFSSKNIFSLRKAEVQLDFSSTEGSVNFLFKFNPDVGGITLKIRECQNLSLVSAFVITMLRDFEEKDFIRFGVM